MPALIELNDVSVRFQQGHREIVAVDGVTVHIEKGDIYGIIGYSGAGKSTLVRTINLLQTPTSGQVRLEGQTIFEAAVSQLTGKKLRDFRRKIGMIFQHFNLLSEKTVFDNVLFALNHSPLKEKERAEKVRHLLSLVELSELADKYPAQLSGGQKQRVAIARALANDPEILLSDEGTSALDPKTTNQILDLLKSLHEKLGITIVLITHEMQVVKEIANKVAVMQQGRVIESGTLLEIFGNPKEELTKQFVATTSATHRFIENISAHPILGQLADDEELVQLSFDGRNTSDPIISVLSKNFEVTASIYFGNVELLQAIPFGSLIIVLKGEEAERTAAKAYLHEKKVDFTVLKDLETAKTGGAQ
jgi:D-methionine transport system ATP-binding protein